MERGEAAVQILIYRNEELEQQCDSLKKDNKTLKAECDSLRDQVDGLESQLYHLQIKMGEINTKLYNIEEGVKAALGDIPRWPEGASYSSVYSIAPSDFGYRRWDDVTSDSTWLNPKKLAQHLPFYDEDHLPDEPQPFPNFLFYDPEPPTPDFKGVVTWVEQGMSSLFPAGPLAAAGLKVWVTRMRLIMRQTQLFIEGIRRLPLSEPG